MADGEELDPDFRPFVGELRAQGAVVEVVSDGFGFFVRAVARADRARRSAGLHGPDDVRARRGDGGFSRRAPHVPRLRHLQAGADPRPPGGRDFTVFVGDGFSDLYAAAHADLVFAKDHLAALCADRGWPSAVVDLRRYSGWASPSCWRTPPRPAGGSRITQRCRPRDEQTIWGRPAHAPRRHAVAARCVTTSAPEVGGVIGIALFSAGRVGRVHTQSIADSSDARLAWVCDPDVEAARTVAERHGARWSANHGRPSTTRTSRYRPGRVRHSDARRSPARGDRRQGVLCEKPIDLDLARVDACLRSGRGPVRRSWSASTAASIRTFRAVRGRSRPASRQARAAADHQPRPGPPPVAYIRSRAASSAT